MQPTSNQPPSYAAFDVETALLDGSPTLDLYRGDARITTAAFSWYREDGSIKSVAKTGERSIKAFLQHCMDSGVKLINHNYQFEYLALMCRFPGCGFEALMDVDTQRLAQMTDGGGNTKVAFERSLEDELAELEGNPAFDGLSLEACASRFLDKTHYRHKQPYIDLMVERGGKSGDFHLLTNEELLAYNVLDSEITLRLYTALTEILAARGIDWRPDHELYKNTSRLCAKSRCRGVLVERELANRHVEIKAQELADLNSKFRSRFKAEIEEIESELTEQYLAMYKSEKGRQGAILRLKENPIVFNTKSTKHLQRLFIDKLKLRPKFLTPSGAPSFGAKFLFQYGEAGKLLKGKGTLLISKRQGEALIDLSEYDGRWHVSVRVASTKSGRLSGGN